MYRFLQELKNFFRKGDMVLLLLCLITTAFGVIMIASTTNYMGNLRYIIIQIAAAGIGVLLYAIISSIDMDFWAEHRISLVIFNTLLLLLLIPFGTDNNTGNRSWLDIPLFPVDIQPAEICKITYILIMASVMAAHQSKLSTIPSVAHMILHLGLLVGLNMLLSRDAGVSLIFVFIFIGMAFAGGVSLWWFILAIGGIVAVWPILWSVMGEHQRNRLLILVDPTVDADGIGARFHSRMSLQSLTGGGFAGHGLFDGNRTQDADNHLFAQHTDYIFSAIGEELGFVGCMLVLLMMICIIARCVYVGLKSPDYMRRMVCFGAAAALIFQVTSNVGMCIGVTPVIGLTLPFMSYGGSSIVSLYAMLGLVSGVHARPASTSHELYIRPY
ncbi:MAG: FtsW/RodA/SpoVE family cell cycle protein [Oscillospiraceae bacterium]|nr:FtsW/RodA/SpoVE family cell cycle protein [Oscillospiraceae bacterium]